MTDVNAEFLYKATVEAAGSVYKGIVFGTHVQFDDHQGSTLCLPFADLSVARIKQEVAASDAKYADVADLHPMLRKFWRSQKTS